MIDHEQLQLLIYQHVVQLTLLDHEVEAAFKLAHRVAAAAFDEAFTRNGLAMAAATRIETPSENQVLPDKGRPASPRPGR